MPKPQKIRQLAGAAAAVAAPSPSRSRSSSSRSRSSATPIAPVETAPRGAAITIEPAAPAARRYREGKHLIAGHFGKGARDAFKRALVAAGFQKGMPVTTQDGVGAALVLFLRYYGIPIPDELKPVALPCRPKKPLAKSVKAELVD